MFYGSKILKAVILFITSLWTSTVIASPQISTTSGIVNGFSNNNVDTFLGIPYGQPPVGELRWKTALPVNASGAQVNATQFGPACGQLLIPGYGSVFVDAGIEPLPTLQSEDCLSLNIWAPRGGRKLPVIVFVHGGAYQTGSSDSAVLNGDHITSTGRAIFVALNYRLNIFGFPSTIPSDGIDQNVGISDVRLALEWVAKNIPQFGGDPARIILTGQSAGSHIREVLLYAYEKNPLVVGQIGASTPTYSTSPADGVLWNAVSDASGCGNITDASQISCMRNVSFDNIKNTALQVKTFFGPTYDGSIVFTNETYRARGANGSFAHVPALLTNVNDEGSLFLEPYSIQYPNGTAEDEVSDVFVCPIAAEASDKYHAGVPVWRARYFAVWPNLSPFPNDTSVGAYHGSDIPMFLGAVADAHLGNGTAPNATQEELKLSRRYMDAWLSFAEDPKDGLSKRLGWPLYDPNGNTLIEIGEHNSSSITFGPSVQYDSTCPK